MLGNTGNIAKKLDSAMIFFYSKNYQNVYLVLHIVSFEFLYSD